jgi:hypothetical protein
MGNDNTRELDILERKNLAEIELRARELDQAERRLAQDRELKREEFLLQARQLALGRWSGPVAVAVVGGLLGIGATFFSSHQNREVERKKQEGTLVLEAIRTGSSGQNQAIAAANLVFLADAGFISLGPKQLEKLRETAGTTTPSLPAQSSPSTTQQLTDSIRARTLKAFAEFAKYFESIGAPAPKTAIGVELANNNDAIAYYDMDKHRVVISPEFVGDPSVPLREYSHSVLYSVEKTSATDFGRAWAIHAIESGLASYFSSSYRNDPSVPGFEGQSLKNKNMISAINERGNQTVDGLLAWGGAFWDLRTAIGDDIADPLLYAAWASLTPDDIKTNDPAAFVRCLIETDRRTHSGKNKALILGIVTARGLHGGEG